LIPLLSAGLNDKAIAAELGISSATLNRRMSELMKKTGTRTRFQLGLHVALDASFTHVLAGNAD
jgi:DNA-binding NarL/FixJ family response regulator